MTLRVVASQHSSIWQKPFETLESASPITDPSDMLHQRSLHDVEIEPPGTMTGGVSASRFSLRSARHQRRPKSLFQPRGLRVNSREKRAACFLRPLRLRWVGAAQRHSMPSQRDCIVSIVVFVVHWSQQRCPCPCPQPADRRVEASSARVYPFREHKRPFAGAQIPR
jgi:hypothetical protein